MSERNLEQEVDALKAEVSELQQQNAQLAHILKKLSDVVKKKIPVDTFDGFVHSEIDQVAASITRR